MVSGMVDRNPSISASEAQVILDAIDKAIEEGGDVSSYTVNGRSVQMRSLDELIRARRYYESMKARANNLRSTKVSF